ncbi:MAG: DUF1998 domain-containing protein [Armatimonadetes bacterium]|nr:DUF1998 domain-containing protein [Armatimonadota bacterium]
MRKRTIRRSHALCPFGVGAIWNFGKESFVGMDISYWRQPPTRINLERLEKKLRVGHFLAPPSITGAAKYFSVPYRRFPAWLFCGNCRGMVRMQPSDEVKGESPRCSRPGCRTNPVLIPMRFVMICSKGHLSDVPWDKAVHSGNNTRCESLNLKFTVDRNAGPGLESLTVSCNSCNARKTVKQIIQWFEAIQAKGTSACNGHQPWEFNPDARCTSPVSIVQRGAGDVYFAVTESALDIPPYSDYSSYSSPRLLVVNHPDFPTLRSSPDGPIGPLLSEKIANEVGFPVDAVRRIVAEEVGLIAGSPIQTEAGDLMSDEYKAFLATRGEQDPRDRFVTVQSSLAHESQDELAKTIGGHFDRVVIATRLRVVRAFIGFERGSQEAIVPADLGKAVGWLPALETYGEGIFLSLNENLLRSWESDKQVLSRVQRLASRKSGLGPIGRHVPEVNPRFLLLHTLSHLLIRQFAFDAGYSSASLGERIYAHVSDSDPRAGILIYTAEGDSEGTLGGLARIGSSKLLTRSVLGALQRAQWCSSDPICSESNGQGTGGMNLAACHACALVAETSCVHMNTALDRVLLIGNERCPGYFQDILRSAENLVVST